MQVKLAGRIALRVDGKPCSLPYYLGLEDDVPDSHFFPDRDEILVHVNFSEGSSEDELRSAIGESAIGPMAEQRQVVVVGAAANPWLNGKVAVFAQQP